MKTIEACPTCGEKNSVFLLFGMAVSLNGSPFGGRTPGVCNSFGCDQRYWYFPSGNRVTRRNVGQTYTEWRKQRDERLINLSAINVRRHYAGLRELIEKPMMIVDHSNIEEWQESLKRVDWSPVVRPIERTLEVLDGWLKWVAAHRPFRGSTDE